MNFAASIFGFTLLLTLSVVPHHHTTDHLRMGYGPVAGDVQVVSSGVLVANDSNVIIPVEWNSGEQLVWMAEEHWELVPEKTLLALSGEVAAMVEEELDARFHARMSAEDEERAENGGWTLEEIAAHDLMLDAMQM